MTRALEDVVMSIDARAPVTGQVSRMPGRTSTPPRLSPEQLLRSSGGTRLRVARARDREAVWLVAELGRPDADAGWLHPGFDARLTRARRALACVLSVRALADAYGREAFHGQPSGREARAVRAAYALRWLELQGGVDPQPWPDPAGGDRQFGPPGVAAQPG
jgi:hypothetical protein